ncbi:malto-oligosyltrehalose trehalohydrolase [Agaricicola taiwanensis]|uniref:Malto-oligosyltrehalose trehalohydrolase n=1 Tax=Agaricicola taiwanensis TaxID=591372 RepID=A0A8J2YCG1_9RHOB|nr:malto-oligosyltrehalose trehalohydrolase [Agaricicola taiwanensis]GGE36727.1 malto-oligosyltrehalose trehalohydrolase [Agaricicola taiwanensis]
MQRLHRMPFGTELVEEGVRFALWAPSAQEVALVLGERTIGMPVEDGGWRRLTVREAKAGDRYAFRIDGSLSIPDPASRFQPDDVHKPSLVVDPTAYRWSDSNWTGRPWEEAVIYEVHVGTATPEGTYAALAGKLEELRDVGITVIELMPVADFPGRRNWGYDGVLLYAPDAAYGTPDDLKRFVDRAHSLGLMVMLDVVYNHFGPSGNYLHTYAKSFFTERHPTPWGAGVNVDGKNGGQVVRDFFIHNALYWLEEYHFDGLRLDAVHEIRDDRSEHVLVELAERVRTTLPHREIHLVLENDSNEASRLDRDPSGEPRHYTAQWNDDVHHAWHALLTDEDEGYYADYADEPVRWLARALAEGFAYQGEPSPHRDNQPRGEDSTHLPPDAFVAFLQNHDQIGNRAFGDRLSDLVAPEKRAVAYAALLLGPNPPMLFMGEDWAASTPFQFFVDFSDDPDLSKAVRDGRRREFGRFSAFADKTNAARIPDPTQATTFEASRLDWSEAEREPHKGIRDEIRRLLELRRRHVVPLLASRFLDADYSLPRPDAFDVIWHYETGDLRFTLNTGQSPLAMSDTRNGWTLLWKSDGVTIDGDNLTLPQWAGAILMNEAA